MGAWKTFYAQKRKYSSHGPVCVWTSFSPRNNLYNPIFLHLVSINADSPIKAFKAGTDAHLTVGAYIFIGVMG